MNTTYELVRSPSDGNGDEIVSAARSRTQRRRSLLVLQTGGFRPMTDRTGPEKNRKKPDRGLRFWAVGHGQDRVGVAVFGYGIDQPPNE